jgi:hypothetical protein
LALSWPMVQEGVMRRSEEEFSEVMRRGMSGLVWRLILKGLGLLWRVV